jgi:hypothetical protein
MNVWTYLETKISHLLKPMSKADIDFERKQKLVKATEEAQTKSTEDSKYAYYILDIEDPFVADMYDALKWNAFTSPGIIYKRFFRGKEMPVPTAEDLARLDAKAEKLSKTDGWYWVGITNSGEYKMWKDEENDPDSFRYISVWKNGKWEHP